MFATLDPTDLPNNPPPTGGSLGRRLRAYGEFGLRLATLELQSAPVWPEHGDAGR